MLKLLKNFFFSKRFSKLTVSFIVLVSVGLGMVLPSSASAQEGDALGWLIPPGWEKLIEKIGEAIWGGVAKVGEKIGGPVQWTLSALVIAVTIVPLLISSAFLVQTHSLLNWVMDPKFISVPFTNNAFVNAGWEITRNLTNILIVLGLVVIALATILRISTYEAKKTLPWLLIVALLVNFSPVICGIIIDASNIVMNYFLKGGVLGTSPLSTLLTELSILTNQMAESQKTLGKSLALIGFNTGAGIIFLLYACLFVLRYVALWMLVIISPLAFFCYVFPYTRKWWDMWFNQFIQWSIIGIPAVFSFYIANQMLKLATDQTKEFISAPSGELVGYEAITLFLLPLAFLVVGFFMSLQTGAAGANIITGAFDKYVVGGGKRAGRWIGRKGLQVAKEATREPRRRAGEALRKIKTGKEAKELEEGAAHGAKQAGRLLAGWALRPFGRFLERGAAEETSREIREAEEKAKGKTAESMALTMEIGGLNQGIGALRRAIKSKELRKIRDRGLVNDEKLKRLARATVRESPELFEDIRDVLPEMAGEIGEEMEGKIEGFRRMGKYKAVGRLESAMKRAGIDLTLEERKKYGTLTEKIRATAKPAKIDLWSKEEMKKALASTTFRRYMTPGQLSQMAKTFESDFFDAWHEVAPSKKWLERWNPPVAKYIERSPSGAFGIPFGKEEPSVSVMGKVSRKWSEEEKREEIPITRKRVPRGRGGPRPGGRGRPGV